MSTSISDVVGQIRATLAATDPDLDTSVGTTTRKIIDAVSESVAEAYLDHHMVSYVYDIDSKMGGDLDTFCQTIGGITRLAPKRASGTITFIREGSTDELVLIPSGTQVQTNSEPLVVAATITSGALLPGQATVSVPVQAVDAGPYGNTAAGTLTRVISDLEGVTSCLNREALTGGTEQETDAELRARWKQTAFRSMAGTHQMYLAQALDNNSVTAAAVFGGSVDYLEQVQPHIPAQGAYAGKLIAESVKTGVAHTYGQGLMVGGSVTSGVLLAPSLDYVVDTTDGAPIIVFNSVTGEYDTGQQDSNGDEITEPLDGGVVELKYRYCPEVSRNDPKGDRFGQGSHLNRIDVIVVGQNQQTAIQSLPFSRQFIFDTATGSDMNVANFRRPDGSHPDSGNIFIPLAFGPVLQIPDTLQIGPTTFGKMGIETDADNPETYQIVHDSTPFGYTANSRFGIEFSPDVLPPDGTIFTVGLNETYIYNTVPADVQDAIERWRLVGTDVQVHAAKTVELRVNLAIMYDQGITRSTVDTGIDQAVSQLLASGGMGSTLQVSDITQAVHNVPGVDNVRLLTPADYGVNMDQPYDIDEYAVGVQHVAAGKVIKTYMTQSGRGTDIPFDDDTSPVMDSVTKMAKAQNTFTV